MCHYMFLNDVDTQRWTLMGTVIKLVQSVSVNSAFNEAATDAAGVRSIDRAS